jgi:hypothetical protein
MIALGTERSSAVPPLSFLQQLSPSAVQQSPPLSSAFVSSAVPPFSGAGCPAPTPSPQALPPSGAAGGAALAAGVVCCGSWAGGLSSPPVTGMRDGWGERGAGRRRRWGHVKSGFLFPIRLVVVKVHHPRISLPISFTVLPTRSGNVRVPRTNRARIAS